MIKVVTLLFVLLIALNSSNVMANSTRVDSSVIRQVKSIFNNGFKLNKKRGTGIDIYADSILKISEEYHYIKGYGAAYELYALNYRNQLNYIKANEYFNKSLSMYEKSKDTFSIAMIHNQLGILYKMLFLYDKSISHYLSAIKLYNLINNKEDAAKTLYNISNIYIRIKNYDKAFEYLDKALGIFVVTNDTVGLALAKINLSRIYDENKDYARADKLLDEAEILVKKSGYTAGDIMILAGKGHIYEVKKNYELAKRYYLESYNKSKDNNLSGNMLQIGSYYAMLMVKSGKPLEAIRFLDKLDAGLFAKSYFEECRSVYEVYKEAYAKLKNFGMANKYALMEVAMKDSVNNLDMLNRLNNIDIIYSIYEKDKYISYLKDEDRIKQLNISKERGHYLIILFVSVAIFLSLVFVVGLLLYRNKRGTEEVDLLNKVGESKLRLLGILEATEQGIFEVDTDGRCTFINRSGSELVGCSVDECIGRYLGDVIKIVGIDEGINCLLDTDELRYDEIVLERIDGSTFVAELSSKQIYVGKDKSGVVITLVDITDRIEIRKKVEGSESKYKLLAENSTDIIWKLDDNNRIVYVSPSISNMLGYNVDEVIDLEIFVLLTPGSMMNVAEGLEQLHNKLFSIKDSKSVYLELEMLAKDGSTMWTETVCSVLHEDNDNYFGVVATSRNINERIKAEQINNNLMIDIKSKNELMEDGIFQKNFLIEELSQIKENLELKSNEKDKFFSILAHDLKSPFAGFLGLTQIFANDIDSFTKSELQEIGMNMHESANNLYKLLENLLQWSRIQQDRIAVDLEDFSISMLIKQNIDLQIEVARQKDIVIVNMVADDCMVRADISMLNTIFRNLLSNALKFTLRGGKIVVANSKSISDNYVCISVKDSGIGMPAEIRDNLFKIDQKVSRPGTESEPSTGLGLLLCKEFIEKISGKLWVESIEGEGSTFYLLIPLAVNDDRGFRV